MSLATTKIFRIEDGPFDGKFLRIGEKVFSFYVEGVHNPEKIDRNTVYYDKVSSDSFRMTGFGFAPFRSNKRAYLLNQLRPIFREDTEEILESLLTAAMEEVKGRDLGIRVPKDSFFDSDGSDLTADNQQEA